MLERREQQTAAQPQTDERVLEGLDPKQIPVRDGTARKLRSDPPVVHDGDVRADGRPLCVGDEPTEAGASGGHLGEPLGERRDRLG